jgi:hypothetical protein
MWVNNDGLTVKFGTEEAASARGGHYALEDQGRHVIDFTIDWKDALSATAAILGSVATVANPRTGSQGVAIPAGFIPEFMETTALTAFTSSGTIGSSTLEIGLINASDRTTALNADAFTTTAFVGSVFDATNENVLVKTGTTGAGDQYGIAVTANGLIAVRNSAHATHPFTAGVLKCRLVGRYGLNAV